MKYFVEDIPSGCCYCDCCHTKDYDCRYKLDGEKFCGIEDLEIDKQFYDFENPQRPNWCPLKALPGQIELKGRITLSGCNTEYEDGWNDCLAAILNTIKGDENNG